VVAVKSGEGLDDGPAMAWDQLRECCRDVLALQRGEQLKRRLEFERERLEARIEGGGWKMEGCGESGRPSSRPPSS